MVEHHLEMKRIKIATFKKINEIRQICSCPLILLNCNKHVQYKF